MNSLIDYITYGKVGAIHLGISRQEALSLMGEPMDWLRQARSGALYESYHQSEVWFYHGECVGIHFDDENYGDEIILLPEKMQNRPGLFPEFTDLKPLTMGKLRTALKQNNISFREECPGLYWIVAGQTCLAYGFPPREVKVFDMKVFDIYECQVQIIRKFATAQAVRAIEKQFAGGTEPMNSTER